MSRQSICAVVNNASTDGTIGFFSYLAKNGFITNSQFTLLNLPENRGELWNDIVILFKTIKVVLKKDGAY